MSTSEPIKGNEAVESADHFICLGSLYSIGGLVSDRISARTHEALLGFASLRHLWGNIHLPTKERVY